MIRTISACAVAGAVAGIALFAVAASVSADVKWHRDLDAGVAAARKSGKPLLVVTAWKSGI